MKRTTGQACTTATLLATAALAIALAIAAVAFTRATAQGAQVPISVPIARQGLAHYTAEQRLPGFGSSAGTAPVAANYQGNLTGISGPIGGAFAGTASPGQSATTTLTLMPQNGFSGDVTLTCSGLPSGATCDFSPATVTVNGAAATSTLTISTTAATAWLASPAGSYTVVITATSGSVADTVNFALTIT